MYRYTLLLPTRASYLSPQDVAQAFKLLDADSSGFLNGSEVQEMFNTVCGCEVEVYGAQERYSLDHFIQVVEMTDARYPHFHVAENLMKYLKDNFGSPEADGLCLENCEKLFGIMDKDGTGELEVGEVVKLFKYMDMHKLAWFVAYEENPRLTSPEDLQGVLQAMNSEHPEQDIDNMVVAFLAKVAAEGQPDLDGAAEVPDPPDHEVGNKKALLVGINYLGTANELGGCINDVRNQMAALIEHFGFAEDNIMLLTEDQDDEGQRPTGARIREGFAWLFEGAAPGDELFFQFSGHGSQVNDSSGTEQDGKNECICPVDCMDGPWPEHVILDNEIYQTFYHGLPEGVKCVCVFDCCHSGTIADLQCTKEFVFDEADRPRYLEPPDNIAAALAALEPAERTVADREAMVPDKQLWTFCGCQDNQTSADATIDGMRQGALTWGFLKALTDMGWHSTYMQLLQAARKNLKGRFSQIPALSTTCEEHYHRWYLEEKP